MSNPCPSCSGRGKILATGIQYAPGHSGPYCGEFPCDRCGGSGSISDDMLKWIEHGKTLKQKRLAKRITLREYCLANEISAVDRSAIERGMVDNLAVE